jgi:hypothetical protein
MRVAVIVVLMLMVAALSQASRSCMSKTEARQHFGSVHIYWHGADHCWDATPRRRHHQIVHKVERKIAQPKWQDSVSKMMPDDEPMQTACLDRWVDIEPTQLTLVARKDDIAQVRPLPLKEPNPEPRGMVLALVFIAIAMTLAIIEVLVHVAPGADRGDRAAA